METMQIAQWTIEVDVETTRAAYAATESGKADTCRCPECRNFREVRSQAYPQEFRSLLEALGIDWRKEAEVHGIPGDKPGLYRYFGWFHFVGRVVEDTSDRLASMSPDFSYFFSNSAALHKIRGTPLAQLEFGTSAPWVLPEERM